MGQGGFRILRRSRRTAPGACAFAALATAAALAPISSQAQSVETAFGRAEVAADITIIDIDDLYFGQIVPRTNPGTVVLTPGATATCTTTGGLVRTGGCQAARFDGQATSGATLRIIRPGGNRITITNPGGATMQVRNFLFMGGSGLQDQGQNGANHRFRVTSATGDFTVYAGATLDVGANQAPGIYTGTFTIHLQYN